MCLPGSHCRFLVRLAPQLKPHELRSVQTHLHLLDANGNGTIEFKEMLTVRRSRHPRSRLEVTMDMNSSRHMVIQ